MIEIYGFPEDKVICPNCRNAVRLCELNGVPYVFYPVISDLVRGNFVRNMPVTLELMGRLGIESAEQISVPQIFIDGNHLGGLTDLKLFFKEKK